MLSSKVPVPVSVPVPRKSKDPSNNIDTAKRKKRESDVSRKGGEIKQNMKQENENTVSNAKHSPALETKKATIKDTEEGITKKSNMESMLPEENTTEVKTTFKNVCNAPHATECDSAAIYSDTLVGAERKETPTPIASMPSALVRKTC